MNVPKDRLTLDLLNAIESNSKASQRVLASETGVALGLVNSYVKRCARRGYIKIMDVPANRYLYYLTPKGFAEKTRLTARYLASSFDFYRRASASCASLIESAKTSGWDRVVFWGASELAEIALLRSQEAGVRVVGVVDNSDRKTFVGIPVYKALQDCEEFDFCIITDLSNPGKVYFEAQKQLTQERILAPGVLGLHKAKNGSSKSTDPETKS